MVFMLSAGSLLVPTVVGSTTSGNWFPQTISWFRWTRWTGTPGRPLPSCCLLVCTVFVIVMMRMFRRQTVGYREMRARPCKNCDFLSHLYMGVSCST